MLEIGESKLISDRISKTEENGDFDDGHGGSDYDKVFSVGISTRILPPDLDFDKVQYITINWKVSSSRDRLVAFFLYILSKIYHSVTKR